MLLHSASFGELVVTWWRDVPILFDHLSRDEMFVQNLLRTRNVYVRIPYGFRIDCDHRPVATLSHASCVIDTHAVLQSGGGSALLQCGKDQIASLPGTGSTRGAHEYVMLVLSHGVKVSRKSSQSGRYADTNQCIFRL